MFEKTCNKRNEHDQHYYDVEQMTPCDGKTPCGEKLHEPHVFLKTTKVVCYGICRCPYVSYPHSPKRHPEGKRVPPIA